MATFQLTPPAPFDFTKPEEWPKWKRRFEGFRISSALSGETGDNQVNTLIYAMGDQADDSPATFKLSEAEEKDYDVELAKMENYFVAKRNVIFERAKFNKRVQEETTTVDSFVTALLYALSEHCSSGQLHDELIRDKIVVGLRDRKLSGRLQLDADLTLKKAIDQASPK